MFVPTLGPSHEFLRSKARAGPATLPGSTYVPTLGEVHRSLQRDLRRRTDLLGRMRAAEVVAVRPLLPEELEQAERETRSERYEQPPSAAAEGMARAQSLREAREKLLQGLWVHPVGPRDPAGPPAEEASVSGLGGGRYKAAPRFHL